MVDIISRIKEEGVLPTVRAKVSEIRGRFGFGEKGFFGLGLLGSPEERTREALTSLPKLPEMPKSSELSSLEGRLPPEELKKIYKLRKLQKE